MSDPLEAYAALQGGADNGGHSLAYFVTAHGFGHATRASAVSGPVAARSASWASSPMSTLGSNRATASRLASEASRSARACRARR